MPLPALMGPAAHSQSTLLRTDWVTIRGLWIGRSPAQRGQQRTSSPWPLSHAGISLPEPVHTMHENE